MPEPLQECSLKGAIARVARAQEHIDDLVQRIEVLRSKQEDAISVEPDPDFPGQFRPILTQGFGIPLEFGILSGEVCYNLRAALDYLVYELSILDCGQIIDGSQFPIEDSAKGFNWRKGGWLRGLSDVHIAAIEQLQPYNGCDWTQRLRDLSNPDKHRRLVFQVGNIVAKMFGNASRLRFLDIPGRVLRTKHPATGEEVDVKISVEFEIFFSDWRPVIETLYGLKIAVAQTLDAFQPEFERRTGGDAHSAPPV